MTSRWLGYLAALWLALSPVVLATNTTTPNLPYVFTPHTTISSSQVNNDLSVLVTELQGNIGTANLLDSSITTVKIVNGAVTAGKLDTTTAANFLVQTGCILDYVGISAPSGWIFADGNTIGNASSGAGGSDGIHNSAAAQALYTLIYTSMDNTRAPVSTGRGANATVDFNAGKTIVVPDLRGRVTAGLDNLGGSAASRLTNVATGANFDATINGNSGGSQSHTLTTAELAVHNHTATDSGHTHGLSGAFNGFNVSAGAFNLLQQGSGSASASGTANITVGNAGSGTAHAIVQPIYVLYKIIKL